MTPSIVKVCGMRDAANVGEIAFLHPNFMGFIYYDPSPRHIGDMPCEVLEKLPAGVMPVLVTVDMEENDLLSLVQKYGFRHVQLHGDESPEECMRLRSKGLFVMKALQMRDKESAAGMNEYAGAVDMLVLDTASSGKGGSGKKFDWSILEDIDPPADFLLSGGISPEDADAVRSFHHPRCVGVDINSRFETTPGIKSKSLVKDFIAAVKSPDVEFKI